MTTELDNSHPDRIEEIKNLAWKAISLCEQLDGVNREAIEAIQSGDGRTIIDNLNAVVIQLEAARDEAGLRHSQLEQDEQALKSLEPPAGHNDNNA